MIRALATCLAAGIGAVMAVAAYGRYVEPARLETTELDLTNAIHPSTIAFVTDLHVGPHFSEQNLEPLIKALEDLKPDFILFGGDFICESPRFLRHLEQPLQKMTATAKGGSWGVWGNHDLANIRQRVTPVLERCGVTMLTNESAHLVDNLWVVGIDDALLGRPDVNRAFADVPADAQTIAMWHEPDLASRLVPYNPKLVLSGHTHGGQIRVPGIGELAAPTLGKRFVAGKYDIDGMPLYVSRGIGMYRPPLRINCRPELVVIHV